MKLTPAWRNRLKVLTSIFMVLTVIAIIYTLVQWILSDPGNFEPLNALSFAIFPIVSALSAWLSRPDNVQPPASSKIALAETPALEPLRQQITALFSLDDLRVLCLDIGIRYDELSGDTINKKTASLLAYTERRGQLPQLMALLAEADVNIEWHQPDYLEKLYDLRRNVHATWISGVLKQSITDEIALELKLIYQPQILTRKVQYIPGQNQRIVEKDVDILFSEYGSLLILGEPGSGKTMYLLRLAEGLLDRAEKDTRKPTPVILNLSSWTTRQENFTEWLVKELFLQYQLSHKVGQRLIQNRNLVYLLDGLDEVTKAARESCVIAINNFRVKNAMPLAICCRASEYESLVNKPNLGMGVQIQPLADAQVKQYLIRPELNLTAVHALWQTDESLRELAQTPLFLSVLTLAYRNLSLEELRQIKTPNARQHHMYHHYIDRMFARRPLTEVAKYDESQTQAVLTQLAHGMQQHEKTVFYLEQLQPTWLPIKLQRRGYLLLNSIIWGLIFGLLLGSILGLIFGRVGFIAFSLIIGISTGIVSSVGVSRKQIKVYEELGWSPIEKNSLIKEVKFGIIIGLFGGLLGGLFLELIDWLNNGLQGGIIGGLLFALRTGLIGGVVGTLIIVLRSRIQIKDSFRSPQPNQGIHNSLQNGGRMALVYGLFSGLAFGLIGGIGNQPNDKIISILILGFILGLMFGFSEYGGQSFMQHYTLRWLLARSGIFPFSIKTDREFIEFLDAMKDRILLRRVGGGWIFIHRTLLDYFASLHPDAKHEADHE